MSAPIPSVRAASRGWVASGPHFMIWQEDEASARGWLDALKRETDRLSRDDDRWRGPGTHATAKEKPMEGKVFAVGSGKVTPLDVTKGDKALFSKYAGTEIQLEGDEHLIIREDDVLAVLE